MHYSTGKTRRHRKYRSNFKRMYEQEKSQFNILSYLLVAHMQIINEGDDQNALICRACIDKIDDFYTYRQQCQENDDRIRKRVHRTSQIRVKQEKDLQLDITISESQPVCEDEFLQEESSQPRISSYSTVNEVSYGASPFFMYCSLPTAPAG